jgi:cell division protease FtsH
MEQNQQSKFTGRYFRQYFIYTAVLVSSIWLLHCLYQLVSHRPGIEANSGWNTVFFYCLAVFMVVGMYIVFRWIVKVSSPDENADNATSNDSQGRQEPFYGSRAKTSDGWAPMQYLAGDDRKTFADVAGCDEAVQKLRRVLRFIKNPAWFGSFGAEIPKGVLQVGPPGTGKTLLARALAGEAEANFFFVSGSDFVQMYVGVGAERMRKLFATAAQASRQNNKYSIIFIDEFDAVGRRRSNDENGAGTEYAQTLNELLVQMDGFSETSKLLVIAATNIVDVLDPAVLRPGRFDYQVAVGMPGVIGREKIFQVHTRTLKLAPDVVLLDLARRTPGFSGAQIGLICTEAAVIAAERTEILHVGATAEELEKVERIITLDDFDEAIDFVQFGDALLTRAQSMTDSDHENTAYHEAGHAIVQQALQGQGANPVTKITIVPRSKSLGMMQAHSLTDSYGMTDQQIRNHIMVLLAGRIAQEKFLNTKDTGASHDFEQAAKLARAMVIDFGMSPLGPVAMVASRGSGGSGGVAGVGAEFMNEIDKHCRLIMEECYKGAEQLVEDNAEALKRVALALLQEKTMLAERFVALWKNEA